MAKIFLWGFWLDATAVTPVSGWAIDSFRLKAILKVSEEHHGEGMFEEVSGVYIWMISGDSVWSVWRGVWRMSSYYILPLLTILPILPILLILPILPILPIPTVLRRKKAKLIYNETFGKKKYLISGDVLNPESEGSAKSHNNRFQKNYNFKMLITFQRKVPQSSYTSQNDHKSKGYPSKTSAAAFTMQKADKGNLWRLEHPPLK